MFIIIIPLIGSFNQNFNLQSRFLETSTRKKTNATTLTVLVVLMELSDDPHHPLHTQQYYQDLFFSDNTDTISQYYLNVSYGEVILTGDVIGWKTAKNSRSYYGQGQRIPPGQDVLPHELAYEAYNYSKDEGKDPTSYDLFVVIHSGDGQEYSGDSDDIWSHKWNLYWFGLSNVEYTMNHEYVGYETPSHELGHALYFPDLYDLSYEHDFAGPYCMMDSGDGHFSIWNKYYSRVSRIDSAQFLTNDYRLQVIDYSKDTYATVNPIAIENPTGIMWIEVGWNSTGFANPEHGRGWTITVRENLDYDKYLPKHGVVMAEIQVGPRSSSQIQVSSDVSPPWNVIDAHPETSENKDDAAFSLNDGDITTYVSGKGWAAQLLERYSNLSYRIRITNETNIPQVLIANIDLTVSGTYTLLIQTNLTSGATVESAEISIDDGPWQVCQPIAGQDGNFTYDWDTTAYREGSHLIRARASDNSSIPFTGYSEVKTFNVDNINGSILVIDDDLGRNSESYILKVLDNLGLTSNYEVFRTSSFTQAEISPYELRKYDLTIWVGNPAITPLSNSHINFDEFLVIKNYLLDSPDDVKPRIIFLSSYNIFDFSNQGSDVESETSKIFKATSPVNFRAPVSTLRGSYFLESLPAFTLGSTASLRSKRSSDGEVVNLLSGTIPILIDEDPAFPGFDAKGYFVDTDDYRILNYLFQPEMVPENILQDLIDLSLNFMISTENITYTTTTTTTATTTESSSTQPISNPNTFDLNDLDPAFVIVSVAGAIGLAAFFALKFLRKGPKKVDSYWLKKK